ncbi:MAG TPA: aquaporin [Solirubrobacteraceae bacterium]|jgi:MIP family channel proteins|nr:aquaporin [Solirubrobacteraceae bacterium]
MEERGLSAYIAELVGTFLLVLFIALIVSIYARLGVAASGVAVIGLMHAFVLMMLIQTLGGVSGAHFNPAITIALVSVRKIKPNNALFYIAAQVVGAIAGAGLAKLILNELPGGPSLGNVSVSQLLAGKTLLGALCELVGTFALVWAVMGVAVNPRAKADWAGWVIGATLGFGVFLFAPLTGAGLNPARALGPAIVSGEFVGGFGKFLVVYIVGPLLGGLIAALGYKVLVLDPVNRAGERPVDVLP